MKKKHEHVKIIQNLILQPSNMAISWDEHFMFDSLQSMDIISNVDIYIEMILREMGFQMWLATELI